MFRAMMKTSFLALLAAMALGGCGKAGGSLSPSDVGNNGEKYKGQKVTVAGVYTQGFSKGGRPTDPWALVIGDSPSAKPTVSCIVPAKVDPGSKYPKITATGTVAVESGNRVFLTDCTYQVEK
jgi:hypothetical protein